MDQSEDRLISEQSFLSTLRSNEGNLLKHLYAEGFDTVRQYVLRNSGSEDDVHDIYQEAFLATWRNLQLLRFSPQNRQAFGAYLLRIAKNKWIDELRKRKSSRKSLQIYPESDEKDRYDDEVDEYIDAVRRNYGKLGERCKELLERFYFREQRLREIAAHFGWSEASAKNNKYRCLKELRESVINEHKNE